MEIGDEVVLSVKSSDHLDTSRHRWLHNILSIRFIMVISLYCILLAAILLTQTFVLSRARTVVKKSTTQYLSDSVLGTSSLLSAKLQLVSQLTLIDREYIYSTNVADLRQDLIATAKGQFQNAGVFLPLSEQGIASLQYCSLVGKSSQSSSDFYEGIYNATNSSLTIKSLGTALLSSKVLSIKPGWRVEQQSWWTAAAQDTGSGVWTTLQSSSGTIDITFITALFLSNTRLTYPGVLFKTISSVQLSDVFPEHPDTWVTFVMDRQTGLIVTSSVARDVGKLVAKASDPRTAASNSLISSLPVNTTTKAHFKSGDVYIYGAAFSRGQGMDWLIVSIIDADAFGKAQSAGSSLAVAAIIIGAGLLLYFVIHVLTAPLHKIVKDAKKVASSEGHVRMLHFSNIAEVNNLQQCFARMHNALLSFNKYVPSRLVSMLLQSNTQAKLGFEPKRITVMFSDIQNFTQVSEEITPATLVSITSEYFEAMSDVIMEEGGILDKYIGDGIMAAWNTLIDVPQHSHKACRAGLRMQRALKTLNERWREIGLPCLGMRIGLHTGTALVGNYGSSKRMEYTCLGDAVNLASRLEGLNKRYGSKILVSKAVFDMVVDQFLCQPMEVVAVKGRTGRTTVYALIGILKSVSQEVKSSVQTFTEAFEYFHAQQFDKALEKFAAYLVSNPQHKDAAEILVQRCKDVMECEDLPEDWMVCNVHKY